MRQAMSSGLIAATRSAMSSGRAAPSASTSSQARMFSPAPSIAITCAYVRHVQGRLADRSLSGGFEAMTSARAAIAEDVAVVLDRIGRVGGNGDRAGAHDRQIGDDPFRPALGGEHGPVAGRDAERDKAARQPADLARGLGPAHRLITAVFLSPQERSVAAPRGGGEEHRRQAVDGVVIHGVPVVLAVA